MNEKSISFQEWVDYWGLTVNEYFDEKEQLYYCEVYDESQPYGCAFAYGETPEKARELLVETYGSIPE